MPVTKISATFESSLQAKAAIKELEQQKLFRFPCVQEEGSAYKYPPAGYSVETYLAAGLIVGTVFGAILGLQYVAWIPFPHPSALMAAIAGMAFVGPAGLLVGGFADVLMRGSLDDRTDLVEPGCIISTKAATADEKSMIVSVMQRFGVKDVVAVETAEEPVSTTPSLVTSTLDLKAS